MHEGLSNTVYHFPKFAIHMWGNRFGKVIVVCTKMKKTKKKGQTCLVIPPGAFSEAKTL